MKTSLLLAALTLGVAAFPGDLPAADLAHRSIGPDYQLVRVESTRYRLRTRDGADAGSIRYLVIDPGSQRVVSALISGGATRDRLVALPIGAWSGATTPAGLRLDLSRDDLRSAPTLAANQVSGNTIPRPWIDYRLDAHRSLDEQRSASSERSQTMVESRREMLPPVASGPDYETHATGRYHSDYQGGYQAPRPVPQVRTFEGRGQSSSDRATQNAERWSR